MNYIFSIKREVLVFLKEKKCFAIFLAFSSVIF